MKCELCKQKIGETFLNKLIGAYIKDSKGKKHTICSQCQKKHRTKDEVVKQL